MKTRVSLSVAIALLCLASITIALKPTAIYHKKRHFNRPPQDNEEFRGKYVITDIVRHVGQLNATLKYQGNEEYYIRPNNKIIKNLRLSISEDGASELGFTIEDLDNERFKLPYREPFPFTKAKKAPQSQLTYTYQIPNIGDEFWITITRKSTRETVFDTRGLPIVFTDKYLYIGTNVQNESIYGVGERNYRFKITPGEKGEFTFWNKDAPFHLEHGRPDGQTYGHHPMYLRREPSGLFHIAFLRNSYGMLFQYRQNESVAFKVIGGTIEMKFFLGDERPETSIEQYHRYVNGWQLHPFWSMGFHQCRWGYTSSQALLEVQQKYDENKLPIDTIWSDIDYMEEYIDFTVDTKHFNLDEMRQMMDLQNPNGVHWVPIIDAGISIKLADYCIERKCYILSNRYPGEPLMGCVWPGKVHYPDFNHPDAWDQWHQGLDNLTTVYGLRPSGFWIDMDEFSNFVNGEIPANGSCVAASPLMQIFDEDDIDLDLRALDHFENTHMADQDEVDNPNPFNDMPYNPCGVEHPLDEKTLSLDAYHYNGDNATLVRYPGKTIYEYDFHQLLGFSESVATHWAMDKMKYKLKFIVSRSSMFGSGRYVTLWQGDSVSDWEWLYNSISYIFNCQLFATPFTGSDICGFGGDATAELCARWMTLGALYPFARNHNGLDSRPQEPYAFPNEPYVLEASRKALQLRYALLKYYYHLFVKQNGTGSVFRPLFFEFPYDESLLDVDWEFMIGDALLAAPVLFSGDQVSRTTQEDVTFPSESYFFDLYSGRPIRNKNKITIIVPFDGYVPLYIRAGTIVHMQDVQNVLRSRYLDNTFELRIALDQNLFAEGTFMTIDDYNEDENIIKNCIDSNCIARFVAQGNVNGDVLTLQLTIEPSKPNTIFQTVQVSKVIVYGVVYKGKTIMREEVLPTPLVVKKPSQHVFNLRLDQAKTEKIDM